MPAIRGALMWFGMVLGILTVPFTAFAEEVPVLEEVPASIGTCQQPDFFYLNVEACPEEITEGQATECRFSAYRYLPDCAYHPVSLDHLIASLRPGVPVCLVIHGAFVSPEWALEEYPENYRQIVHAGGNRPMHVIAVHWPSEINLCPFPTLKLLKLARRADAIGLCIARFLAMLPAENNVCLLGHSYGTRVAAVALQAMSRGIVADPIRADTQCRRRMRAVFTASIIDHHWLNPGERLDHTLDRVECLLNFQNLLDPALKAYPLTDPCFDHPLGQNGFNCIDKYKLRGQWDKVTERNVTLSVGCGHTMVRYLAQPAVMNWIVPYLFFD